MAHGLTQQEADFLFGMEKFAETANAYAFPSPGEKLILPFASADKHERFIFDVFRSSIKISKITYQSRVRKALVLRRLDLDGAPHLNPEVEYVPMDFLAPYNGMEIGTPHLHIYVEGFGAKWAVPADLFLQTAGKDICDVMLDFFVYCNARSLPSLQKNVFV